MIKTLQHILGKTIPGKIQENSNKAKKASKPVTGLMICTRVVIKKTSDFTDCQFVVKFTQRLCDYWFIMKTKLYLE